MEPWKKLGVLEVWYSRISRIPKLALFQPYKALPPCLETEKLQRRRFTVDHPNNDSVGFQSLGRGAAPEKCIECMLRKTGALLEHPGTLLELPWSIAGTWLESCWNICWNLRNLAGTFLES